MSDFPKDINELPFNEAMALYEQMRQAYYDGNEQQLQQLRKQYPSMFEEETANLLRTTAECLSKMRAQPQTSKFTIH